VTESIDDILLVSLSFRIRIKVIDSSNSNNFTPPKCNWNSLSFCVNFFNGSFGSSQIQIAYLGV